MIINVSGDLSGQFSLVHISPNTTAIPISSYNEFIYNVATLDENQNVLKYTPNGNSNPFTKFESNKHYLIFSKKNFTLSVADYFQDKFILSGSSEGTLSFFDYNFNTSVPISAFSDKFKYLQQTTSDRGTLVTYLSGRSINPIKTLQKNRIYAIEVIKDFIVYNRDTPAVLQEDFEEFWVLQENGIDRLLLE